jgi:hypothetical protein
MDLNNPSPSEFAAFLADAAAAARASGDMRTPAMVSDRDGTLASVAWVRPSDRDTISWHRFNAGMPFDAPVPYVVDLVRAVPDGIHRFMFSGRMAGNAKGQTFRRIQMTDWLRKHDIPIDTLLMRAGGDQRRDSIVKNEFVDLVSRDFVILAAIDDRQQVCDETWRARGIPLVQVVDPEISPALLGGEALQTAGEGSPIQA